MIIDPALAKFYTSIHKMIGGYQRVNKGFTTHNQAILTIGIKIFKK
jgi:hypothetical protein